MRAGSKHRRGPSARRLALRILRRVEEAGAFASVLLDHYRSRLEDAREAALTRELVLGVLRRRAILDHALVAAANRPLDRIDPAVLSVLRIAVYEILYLDRIPDFASVDSAVEAIRAEGQRSAAGFVNGVLRAVARDGAGRLPEPPAANDIDGLALYHSHPRWWVVRLVDRLGWETTDRLLAANNRPAATVVRPNLRRTDPRELQRRLKREGVLSEPARWVPDALRIRSGAVQQTEAFRDGSCWIQDEASQLIPLLFGPELRPRVVDLCAAPGGKTLQLEQRLPEGGQIVACDLHPGRLRRLRHGLERVGAERVLAVAADMSTGRPAVRGPFDHLLVDAPCTGTGTLRRHPEIRWRLRPGDPERLAEIQRRILSTAAALSGSEASLVYAVCSQEPEEGRQVVDRFLKDHPEFELADPAGHLPAPARRLVGEDLLLVTSPADGELDGFCGALLLRRSARRVASRTSAG